MSDNNTGQEIKEGMLMVLGFIVGALVGNQVYTNGAMEVAWSWLVGGGIGLLVGWMLSEWG